MLNEVAPPNSYLRFLACALHPPASHFSAAPSFLAPDLALKAYKPLGLGGVRPAIDQGSNHAHHIFGSLLFPAGFGIETAKGAEGQ